MTSVRRNTRIRPLRTAAVTARLESTDHIAPTAPQINKLERVVATARDELAAICRHHRNRRHVLRMPSNLHGLARCSGFLPEIPDPRRTVVVTTDDNRRAFAVRHRVAVARAHDARLAETSLKIPDLYSAIVRARHCSSVVPWTELGGHDLFSVAGEGVPRPARGGVPETHRSIRPGSEDHQDRSRPAAVAAGKVNIEHSPGGTRQSFRARRVPGPGIKQRHGPVVPGGGQHVASWSERHAMRASDVGSDGETFARGEISTSKSVRSTHRAGERRHALRGRGG
mmetsp:Transcript_12289/g.56889  ORF Transcript_12289/g.56889 Transcript_12289/m.56889 type:complete len:283 (-) Transcript_12289:2905-3753(-)